ncbi:hypothetical protein BN2497_1763 [Janthinobacterium sp. CG23_2]|nr:hypothetical protein BN2497_1763 [Janthinobacterium sp. CG23_2]CUU27279.1 hypothetical protein BN3177_1763 [Janthinobacterium sp. CG23_2]
MGGGGGRFGVHGEQCKGKCPAFPCRRPGYFRAAGQRVEKALVILGLALYNAGLRAVSSAG